MVNKAQGSVCIRRARTAVSILVAPENVVALEGAEDLTSDGASTGYKSYKVGIQILDANTLVPYGQWSVSALGDTSAVVEGLLWELDKTEGTVAYYVLSLKKGSVVNMDIPFMITYKGNTYSRRIRFTTIAEGNNPTRYEILPVSGFYLVDNNKDTANISGEISGKLYKVAGDVYTPVTGATIEYGYSNTIDTKGHTTTTDSNGFFTTNIGDSQWFVDTWDDSATESLVLKSPSIIARYRVDDDIVVSYIVGMTMLGKDGSNGTNVTTKGTVPTKDDLLNITNPSIGDGYIAEDTGHLHVYTENGWVDAGRIRGEDGKSIYLHMAWANFKEDSSGTLVYEEGSFTLDDTPSLERTHMGTYSDYTKEDSTDYTKYSWKRIQGNGIISTVHSYQVSTSGTDIPTGTWLSSSPATDNTNKYLWRRTIITYTFAQSQTIYEVVGVHGDKGIDGDTTEYIYKLTDIQQAPDVPTSNDPITTNNRGEWTDDPQDVDEDNYPYQWISKHVKTNGVWGPYTEATLWNKWGKDGKSSIVLDLDNENDSMLYDGKGSLISGNVTSQARLFVGGVEKTNEVTSWECVDKENVTATINSSGLITVTGISNTYGSCKARAKYGDDYYYAQLTVKKLVGVDKYEIVVTPNAITYNSTDKEASATQIQIEVYCTSHKDNTRKLIDVSDAQGLYLKYTTDALDGGYWYLETFGGIATINSVDTSCNYYQFILEDTTGTLDSETVPISKTKNGTNGTGINPKGTVATASGLANITNPDVGDGYVALDTGHLHVYTESGWVDLGPVKGDSAYLHIAWADVDEYGNITNFTLEDTSEEHTHMGVYTDDIEADSTDPDDYTWKRIRGGDGDTIIPIYKASYAKPSSPTSDYEDEGWKDHLSSLIDKVEITYGGLWFAEGNGTYRSHEDLIKHTSDKNVSGGIEEYFYFNNLSGGTVDLPFCLMASSEEDIDIGHLFVSLNDDGSYSSVTVGQGYNGNTPKDARISVSGTQTKEGVLRIPTGRSFVVAAYTKDSGDEDNSDCVRIQFGYRPYWVCYTAKDSEGNIVVTNNTPAKTSNYDSKVTPFPEDSINDNLLLGARFREGRRDSWILSNDAFFTSGFGKANVIQSVLKTSYYEFARYTLYDINGSKTLLNRTSYVFSAWTKGNNVGVYLYGKFKGEYTYTEYDSNAGKDVTYAGDAEIEETTYLVSEASERGYANSDKQFMFGYASGNNYARRVIKFKTLSDMTTGSRTFEDKNIWINGLNGTRTVDLVNCKLQEVTLRFCDDTGNYNAGVLMPKLETGSYPTEFNVNDQDIAGLTGKLLYPAGVYNSETRYESTEKATPVIMVYNAYNTVAGFFYLNKESAKGINPLTDTSGTWVKADSYQLVIAEAVMANFAKLSSAVFYKDYMFSQYGANGSNYADYASEGKFEEFFPNIKLDFKTGKAQFLDINIGGDATFEGVATAKALYRGIKSIIPYEELVNGFGYDGHDYNNPILEDFIVIRDKTDWVGVFQTLASDIGLDYIPLYIPNPTEYKGKEILLRNGLARSEDTEVQNVNIRITTPDKNATIGEGYFYDTSGGDDCGINTVVNNTYLETVRMVSDGEYWVVFEKVYIN